MKTKLFSFLCMWGLIGAPILSYAEQKSEAQVDLILCPGQSPESHSLFDWKELRNQPRPETKGRGALQIVADAAAELTAVLPLLKNRVLFEYKTLFSATQLKDYEGVDFTSTRPSISVCPLQPVLIWREPLLSTDPVVHRDADRWMTLDEMTKASLSLELILQKMIKVREANQRMIVRHWVGLLLSGRIRQLSQKSLIELQNQITLSPVHMPFMMGNKINQMEITTLDWPYRPTVQYTQNGELDYFFGVGFGIGKVKIGNLEFDCKQSEARILKVLKESIVDIEGPNAKPTACLLSQPMGDIQSFGFPFFIKNGQLCSENLLKTNGQILNGCFRVEGL